MLCDSSRHTAVSKHPVGKQSRCSAFVFCFFDSVAIVCRSVYGAVAPETLLLYANYGKSNRLSRLPCPIFRKIDFFPVLTIWFYVGNTNGGCIQLTYVTNVFSINTKRLLTLIHFYSCFV